MRSRASPRTARRIGRRRPCATTQRHSRRRCPRCCAWRRQLRASETYRYDLVDIARQTLANESRMLLPQIKAAFDAKDARAFDALTHAGLHLMDLQDRLLASNRCFSGRHLAWLGCRPGPPRRTELRAARLRRALHSDDLGRSQGQRRRRPARLRQQGLGRADPRLLPGSLADLLRSARCRIAPRRFRQADRLVRAGRCVESRFSRVSPRAAGRYLRHRRADRESAANPLRRHQVARSAVATGNRPARSAGSTPPSRPIASAQAMPISPKGGVTANRKL